MHIEKLPIKKDVEEILQCDLPWQSLYGQTILITGAGGMIPAYIVYTLLKLNDEYNAGIHIVGLVRNKEKAEKTFDSLLSRKDFQLLVQDVCDPLHIEGPVDYIIHGGSAARPGAHKAAPTATIKANLMGTFNLLDLAVEKNSKGFVLMSSSEVYGAVDETLHTIQESQYGYIDILNPRSCYSEGKRAAETICASYQAQFGIPCKAARFAHIYGPGLALDDGRVQAEFAAKVIHNENIVMNSDGSSTRAYTYVSDAVCGLFYVLLKGTEIAYNVANSQSIVSIRQLAESFIAARPEKKLSLEINIPKESAGLYNPAKFIGLDGNKLEALGWQPKVALPEGVDRMLSSYEEQ